MQNKIRSFNCWCAVAHTHFGEQHLLYMGISMEQVKKNYPGSFYEILQVGEQSAVNRISLEKWFGGPEKGHWAITDNLKVPRVHKQVV